MSWRAADYTTAGSASPDELPPGDPWPESDMLAAERELLGFYISGHPLTAHEWALTKFSLVEAKHLETLEPGTVTRVGGLATQLQKRFTKAKQEPFGVFRLEHLNGSVEVVAFPDTYREFGVYLQEAAPVMVCGEVSKEEQGVRIKAYEIYPLKEVHRYFTERISVHLPAAGLDDGKLLKVKEILGRHPGETAVHICLEFPTGEKVFVETNRQYKAAATEKFVREIEHAIGEDSVYIGVCKRPCRKPNSGRNGKQWAARRTQSG